MSGMSPSNSTKALAVSIGLVWAVLWLGSGSSEDSPAVQESNGRRHGRERSEIGSVYHTDEIPVPSYSTAEVARTADFIFVGTVESSEYSPIRPIGCENCPDGVGAPSTLVTITPARVIKGDVKEGETVAIRQEGGNGVATEGSQTDQFLEVGRRYLFTLEPMSEVSGASHFLFPVDAGFTEITTQQQEDALVAEYEGYLDVTPVPLPSLTPVTSSEVPAVTVSVPTLAPTSTPVPAHTATSVPTDTPVPADTATATVESTSTATIEPCATATAEPTATATAESSATVTIEPTATATAEQCVSIT
jgi:hypothetical protein